MRAHLVQFDLAWEDKPRNFNTVETLLARAAPDPGDLVILPEMFDTGFSFNTPRTADHDGSTATFLTNLARERRLWVQGARTLHESHSPKATNRALVVGPDGRSICDYAKIHPFTFGKEADHFMGGSDIATYRWGGPDGPIVCPAICYDLRFPELFRLGLLKGAEIFAVAANWPDARHAHWRALLIARAIENQAIVLGVNRTGRDPALTYAGGSIAIGPKGDVLAELGPEQAVLSVPVDITHVRQWRATFPAWRDLKLIHPAG